MLSGTFVLAFGVQGIADALNTNVQHLIEVQSKRLEDCNAFEIHIFGSD